MKDFRPSSLIVINITMFVFLMTFSTEASAQRRRFGFHFFSKRDTTNVFVERYVDSLKVCRQQLAALQDENDSLCISLQRLSPDYYRMFVPLTFYHDIAGNSLNISPAADVRNNAIDNAMLSAYLHRPDLVKETENRLRQTGGIDHTPETPVRHNVDFTAEADKESEVEKPEFVVPIELVTEKPNFWVTKGDYSVQFLQNYVTPNWYKGGESNYSMIAAATLQANYDNKQKIKWDNKLEMKLGFLTSPGDSIHTLKTSEDLLRLTSKLGLQASKKWYYTLQLIGYTQFTRGYKSNDSKVYSDLMSPLNVNLSLGMDYKVEWFKKHLTGTINMSPLAYNFRYVSRLALSTRYSLEEGSHTMHDFGSSFTADLLWKFTDDISLQSRLYAYTTYKRVEVEWENTINLQINKYIATKLFLYPRFDDSAKRDDKHGYLQFKEYLSLGFSYTY